MKIRFVKPDMPSISDVSAEFDEILQNGQISNFGKYMRIRHVVAGSTSMTYVIKGVFKN